MLYSIGNKFEEWLLPRGRTLLVGLVAANVCLTVALWVSHDPAPAVMMAAAEIPEQVEREIQLLAEVPPSVSPEPGLTPMQKPARECRIWGPEQSPEAFDELITQLQDSGSFPELQSLEVKAAPDYLVYVGELGSQDNAKRLAQELEALNIESYAISRQGQPLMLSVGVFSRKALAQKQKERIAELGYAVAIEELERAQTVYQLSAHVEEHSEAYKSSTSPCIAIAHNT